MGERLYQLSLTLPIGEKELTEKITNFLNPFRQIGQVRDEQFVRTLDQFDLDLAHELYQQLVEPAEPYLKNVPTLLIVPDGVLHNLPFEMLVIQNEVGATGRSPLPESLPFSDYTQAAYLIEKYPIAYAPSASVLKPEILYYAQ
ncbi:MAG: CHAT domain-containing protein [Nitrospira sp.]|nr:CHAT domain-containing protein [Nitrospira sp.]